MSDANSDPSQHDYIETLNEFFGKVGTWSFDHRWVVLFLCALIIGTSGFFASKGRVDLTFQAFFDEQDPTFAAYLQYRDDFGSDEIAYIMYEVPDSEHGPFDLEAMRKIADLTEVLVDAPFVEEVTSLANVEFMESIPDGLDVHPLLEDFPETQEELLEIRDKVLEKPLLLGGLVTPDAKYAAIIVEMERSSIDPPEELKYDPEGGEGLENYYPQVSEGVISEMLARPEYEGIVFYISGDMPWNAVYNRIMLPETAKMMGLSFLLIGGLLFAFFRRRRSFVGPFAVVMIAMMISAAIVGAMGWDFDMMFLFLPSLLISIGVADSVHIISEFNNYFEKLGDRREAVRKTMELVGTPCMLTSLTTAAGLSAMSISHIESIAHLAVYSAIGILAAFVLTVSLLMTLFAFGRRSYAPPAPKHYESRFVEILVRSGWWVYHHLGRILIVSGIGYACFAYPDLMKSTGHWLLENPDKPLLLGAILLVVFLLDRYFDPILHSVARFNIRYSGRIFAFFALVFIASFLGVLRLNIDTNFMDEWKEGTPIKDITLKVDGVMGGMNSVIYLFDTGEAEGIKSPEVLREIERVQLEAEKQPDFVKKTYSIVDVIKDLNRTLHDDDPAYYRIPESQELVAQLILLYEMQGGEDLEEYVSGDLSRANLELRCRMTAISRMQALVDDLDAYIEKNPIEHATVEVTGIGALWLKFAVYITDSQIKGILLAFTVIAVLMCFIFRSVKIGLLSMIPNISPVFLTIGFMGWYGIDLDYTRLLIAPLAIGIAVDDTIHLVTRYHVEFRKTRNYGRALEDSLFDVGRALIGTTVILVVGFLINIFHGMETQVVFGKLVASTIVVALIADFFLMPALILTLKPFGPERDVELESNAE